MKNLIPLSFVISHELLSGSQGIAVPKECINWTIVNANEREIEAPIAKVFKDAFFALFSLASFVSPFSTKISGIKPDEKNRRLILCGKVWGAMYFQGQEILRFDYYTEQKGIIAWDFTSILEWPQIMPAFKCDALEEVEKVIEWSCVANWISLFRTKLVNRSNEFLMENNNDMGYAIADALFKQKIPR